MRKLWSNTRVRRVRKKEQAEDSSYPKGIEVMLRETVRKSYPENVDNPMTASRDCEVRQSARDLELQNNGLWIRPTDLLWHFPIPVTVRELPFKNYRGRSIVNLGAWGGAWGAGGSWGHWVGSNIQGYHMAVTFLLAIKSLYIDLLKKGIYGGEDNGCL